MRQTYGIDSGSYFFFQAEDGIRYLTVTGVQTCALPIFVDQSFQAGFAELARGVLHNLGNAMTPIGVRLALLHSRLRAAPLDDFEMAAAELARPGLDGARRADLEQFVHLACGQLTSIMQAAAQDVE